MTTLLIIACALAYLTSGAVIAGLLRDYLELPLSQIVLIAALWPLIPAYGLCRIVARKVQGRR